MTKRQRLAAQVWHGLFRTWWPDEGRNKARAKRRSAKRERYQAKHAIRKGAE